MMIKKLNEDFEQAKKIKRLILMVQKYLPNVDILEATTLLNSHTNLLDTEQQIEEQFKLYLSKRGEV